MSDGIPADPGASTDSKVILPALISDELPVDQPYLLLADDTEIASRPGGYVVEARRYYVDLDEGVQPSTPILRRESDRLQLIVPLGAHSGQRSCRYSLVW